MNKKEVALPPCWWIDHGSHGQITQREEEATAAEKEGKIVVRYAAVLSTGWREMVNAPKDGTMLRLLVNPDQNEFTAFDDSLTPFETIGFNNLENTEEDRWEFAGWDWQQDCFITGRGEVIGWAEMLPGAADTVEVTLSTKDADHG